MTDVVATCNELFVKPPCNCTDGFVNEVYCMVIYLFFFLNSGTESKLCPIYEAGCIC